MMMTEEDYRMVIFRVPNSEIKWYEVRQVSYDEKGIVLGMASEPEPMVFGSRADSLMFLTGVCNALDQPAIEGALTPVLDDERFA